MHELTAEIAKIAENTNDETLLGDNPRRGVTYDRTKLFEIKSLCVLRALRGEIFGLA
jgi:hypothetical protein